MSTIPPPSHRPALWLRVLSLVAVLGVTVGVALHREQLHGFAALGYAGAFLAMLLSNATLVLPAPGLIVVFALGSSLNPLLVGVAGALGAALGEVTGYLTGYSGLVVIEQSGFSRRLNGWMERNGALTIFALSVVPNPFFDLAGLLAGASRMPVWRFLGATFFGKAIQAILVAVAGALSLQWVETWLTH